MPLLRIDFTGLEHRVFETNVDAALSLPRRHPMRFALLYGCGKEKLRRLALGLAYDMPSDRLHKLVEDGTPAEKLAADIAIFERWQDGRAGRSRRENAAIAFAAAEAGILPPESEFEHRGTITGRLSISKPCFEEVTRD